MKALAALLTILLLARPAAAQTPQEGYDAYDAQNYERAFEILLPFAEQGVGGAQFFVGLMYSTGRGTVQDVDKARYWYEQAADRGESSAMFNLGLMYNEGDFGSPDHAAAFKWYLAAAKLCLVEGMINVAAMYGQGEGVEFDRARSLAWVDLAQAMGSTHWAKKKVRMLQLMTTEEIREGWHLYEQLKAELGCHWVS